MVTFFTKTWFLWYAFAVVVITRWFHVAAEDGKLQVPSPRADNSDLPPTSPHLTANRLI
jgi:hypothetical protein